MRFIILMLALALPSCERNIDSPKSGGVASTEGHHDKTSHSQSESCINLNTATKEQLEPLPGIGEVIAERIIEYREHHRRFRRPEEIIIVEGVSEQKYRDIANSICVE